MNLFAAAGLSSAFLFAVMNTLTSHKLAHLPAMTLVFYRGLFTAIFLLPFVAKEIPVLLGKKAIPIHGRSITGGLSILCLFWTLKETTSLHASFLASLAPLFLSLILFLKNENRLAGLNRVGFWLVIIGSMIVSGSPDFSASLQVWMIGFLGAFLSALAMYFLKQSTTHYSPYVIVFNLSLVLTLIGLGSWQSDIAKEDILPLFIMCSASALAQVLMTISYKGLMPELANGLGRSLILWVAIIELLMTHTLPGNLALSGYFLATIGVVTLQWKRKA